MEINRTLFGTAADGMPVDRYTLSDGRMTADVITYGGALQSLRVPDRNGRLTDVLLGYDSIEAYQAQDKYLGALIGRCANRISDDGFALNGTVYLLAHNSGPNHLHGGLSGFDRRHWTALETPTGLVLRYSSADGEEGYPGRLQATVTYALENGALSIEYRAETDADTLCNLTNHSYFNLAGHGSGPVGDQTIRLHASQYTPADANAVPTGKIAPVDGTPMDLREEQPIGAHWDDAFEQLAFAGGYDHNWVIDGKSGVLRPTAEAYCTQTGIHMEVQSTQPGVQFYTGNFLDAEMPLGKGGVRYGRRHGFCLETQCFPDAVHHPNFPQPILRAGHTYRQKTVYRFFSR